MRIQNKCSPIWLLTKIVTVRSNQRLYCAVCLFETSDLHLKPVGWNIGPIWFHFANTFFLDFFGNDWSANNVTDDNNANDNNDDDDDEAMVSFQEAARLPQCVGS